MRIVNRPPDNASAYASAPASLDATGVGHVQITGAVDNLRGEGVLEVVPE